MMRIFRPIHFIRHLAADSSRSCCFLWILLLSIPASAQQSYADSIATFQTSYRNGHEVVKGKDREKIRFFPIREAARVHARIEFPASSPWITMETSSGLKKVFRVYAYLHFRWQDTDCRLAVYQSQGLLDSEEYRNYLLLPFTDLSNEDSTYEVGRYLDLTTTDLKNSALWIDFNKAYNPYCAYVSGKYNCPIPPAGNRLPVRIEAGELKFRKETH